MKVESHTKAVKGTAVYTNSLLSLWELRALAQNSHSWRLSLSLSLSPERGSESWILSSYSRLSPPEPAVVLLFRKGNIHLHFLSKPISKLWISGLFCPVLFIPTFLYPAPETDKRFHPNTKGASRQFASVCARDITGNRALKTVKCAFSPPVPIFP